jgi:hypothetical protein
MRLLHIRDNIHLARKFVEGLDYEAFRDIIWSFTRSPAVSKLSLKRRDGYQMN